MKFFSEKTIHFLIENRLQNSRDWFLTHKPEFNEFVLEPLVYLVEALSDSMHTIDSGLITEPKVDRTISRIYRDTRFSKDKALYRENMWCVFMRDKKLYHGPPALFFELFPDSFRYGCGYYQASISEMDAMRELILEDHKAFVTAKNFTESQDVFQVSADRYKRNRFPGCPTRIAAVAECQKYQLDSSQQGFFSSVL